MSQPSPRIRKCSPRQQAHLEQARYMHTELKAGRIPYPEAYSLFNVFAGLYHVLHIARATEADLGTTEKKLYQLYLTLHRRWLRKSVIQLRKATMPDAPLTLGNQINAEFLSIFIEMEDLNPARAGTSREELKSLIRAVKLKEIEQSYYLGISYMAQAMMVFQEADIELSKYGAKHTDVGISEEMNEAFNNIAKFIHVE